MVWLFVAALLVHLTYWILLAAGLSRAHGDGEGGKEPSVPVSVLVAARNEEERLETLFRALEAQTHERFEVIIVDDASDDGTAELVERQAAADPRVRLVRIRDPRDPRKKHALAAGVAAASYERLAFTDADCEPEPGWLAAIARQAHEEPDVVLVGYGPLRKEPGVLNSLVRYETLVTALLTAGTTGLGRPYMAVGRNFSYPKSLFLRVGGFDDHLDSLSGDDDLLVQQARREGAPVRYLLEERAFVASNAPSKWRDWLRQKLRHTSAGRHYDRTVQLHLSLFHASNLGIWLAPVFLGWTGAALLAGRFLVQRGVLKRAADAFHAEPDLMIYHPLLDLGYLLYNTLLAPAGVFVGGRRW